MSFVKIKQKIKTKLQAINSIQAVEDYPNEEWNGFPAAMISTGKNESEFETTTENERIYTFLVYLLMKVDDTISEKKARTVIDEVVDDIIYAFDIDQELVGIDLPSNETMIISMPALGGVSHTPPYVTAEIEIKVKISFNTNA